MDTQTVDLSTFSADLMDTPQAADSSIFKAPADVHCFSLARNIHIQMARELGLNPRKFGSLANDQQEPWKRPLAEFIAHCYSKRFGRSTPEHVQSLEEVVKRAEQRRSERRERKANKAVPPTGPQRTDSGSTGKLPDLHEHGSE